MFAHFCLAEMNHEEEVLGADLLGLEKLPVKFPLVHQLPPAAQSLQFTEQRGQTAVLQPQLVHLFLLAEQAEHEI